MDKPFERREVWTVLGLPFDAVTLKQAAQNVVNAIENREPCFISTPNINFAINALHDEDFYHSVLDSDLSLADGMPLLWIAKLLSIPLPERVAGSDLFNYLSQHALSQRKIRVFFFGGPPGVAEQAHNVLNKQMKAAVSCGYYDPGFVDVEKMSTPEIIETINAAKPDFVVVALGAKKGQKWIQQNRTFLDAPVISHLGAVVNFVAGSVKRAPLIYQKLGMEWLWRIKQEPGLWHRYFYDGLTLVRLVLTKAIPLSIYGMLLRLRLDYKTVATSVMLDDKLVLQGSFWGKVDQALIEQFDKLIRGQGNLVIEMSHVTYIDGAFIARLLLLQRYLNKQNRKVSLLGVSERIKRLLILSGVLHRFQLLSDNN